MTFEDKTRAIAEKFNLKVYRCSRADEYGKRMPKYLGLLILENPHESNKCLPVPFSELFGHDVPDELNEWCVKNVAHFYEEMKEFKKSI